MTKSLAYIFFFLSPLLVGATDTGMNAIQLPTQCQNRPLFEVEKQIELLGDDNIEVRFCHGMILKSKFNKNEIEGQGTTFSVTYADGSTEEIRGILVADVESRQIHIYHPSSSKLPKGALQPNGYNPSWFDQFVQAYDGRGYFRTMHPVFDSFYRNVYEYSSNGFGSTLNSYLKTHHLLNGQFEVTTVVNHDSKYVDRNLSGTYRFTPFLSLQEVYTGKRSFGLKKSPHLCNFVYHDVDHGKETPISKDELEVSRKLVKGLLSVECQRRKNGSFKTDERQTEIFLQAYEREFGAKCTLP
ncbi:MAG: hypothetical protein A4S09_06755 [Proteobacteria bacterium SG_bin7]|nr:MAG: hypothetical protein A4S09_06755 [Proteobacteria bacterium SG_bin7]